MLTVKAKLLLNKQNCTQFHSRTSFIKIGSEVLAPRGVEICHFPMFSAMAYITG